MLSKRLRVWEPIEGPDYIAGSQTDLPFLCGEDFLLKCLE